MLLFTSRHFKEFIDCMNELMTSEEKSSLTKIIIECVTSFFSALPSIHTFNFICVYIWYDVHLGIQDSELRNRTLKSVWRPVLHFLAASFDVKLNFTALYILQIFKFLNIYLLINLFLALFCTRCRRSGPEERIVLLVAHWKDKALYFAPKFYYKTSHKTTKQQINWIS